VTRSSQQGWMGLGLAVPVRCQAGLTSPATQRGAGMRPRHGYHAWGADGGATTAGKLTSVVQRWLEHRWGATYPLWQNSPWSLGACCSPKLMKDKRLKSLAKPQGPLKTKAQGVHLVRVMDTPVILSHNEWTKDKHGNACVQYGLTMW
jgi:hypothetical protein